MTNRIIKINTPALTRVEGEGALNLEISNNKITEIQLNIFEPPRYFEKLLEGRAYTEVLDITARICGICPVAYQMSAVMALESIVKVRPTPWLQDMRRLFYCGEWLQSHALHIHLLALPDFLGFKDALAMGQKYPEALKRGLKLQDLGNDIVRLLGGRSVHPVGACVGGFSKAPAVASANELADKLIKAVPALEELIDWLNGIELPDIKQDFVSVALSEGKRYPMIAQRLTASDGLDIDISEFEEYFEELHMPHSTALHALYRGQPYLVGPLARLNLHYDNLPKASLDILAALKFELPSANIYHSLIARAVEMHAAVITALEILRYYQPEPSQVSINVQAGVGYGASEAPRGFLWHKYELNSEGLVTAARLVPPTSQNQAQIERDIVHTLTELGLDKPAEDLQFEAERVIRNYDPCISCATHFLKLKISRN
jgi:coenzyme F420-reducing hydrogenase alpha subunit